MMKESDIRQAGAALFAAEQSRQQIGLLSLQYPQMDMDDAYRVQDEFVRQKRQAGQRQIGWKIGLTSKAMQNALGIDIPDSGVLFDNMLFNTGAYIPNPRFIQPRVEAEIAFVMKEDVVEPSEEAILDATEYVAPSLEILDTRILRTDPTSGATRNVIDTISDNAANAGIVLGAERHDPRQIDLRWVGTILKRNGEVEETGLGAAVLDHPLTSVSWLARRLAQYGRTIRAGDIVLSGSFIKIVEATAGSSFHADFGDFGVVELAFE